MIHQEKIIEVAADLLRRCHRCEDIELLPVGKRWKSARQNGLLDPGGDAQLLPQRGELRTLLQGPLQR